MIYVLIIPVFIAGFYFGRKNRKYLKAYDKVLPYPFSEYIPCYSNSLLAMCVFLYNKIFKKQYEAIVNPFNSRVHLLDNSFSIKRGTARHAYIHSLQISILGRVRFICLYIKEHINNKENNFFEVQAKNYAYYESFDYYNDLVSELVEYVSNISKQS